MKSSFRIAVLAMLILAAVGIAQTFLLPESRFLLVPNVQMAVEAQSQSACRYMKSRNGLSEYDKGGPYTLEHFRLTKGRTDLREFLWNHWIQRKPANLLLTADSKEGKVTHSEYKITLLPGNSLLLKVTFVRDRIGAQGQVIPKPDGGYEAYTVERVESENPFAVGPEAKVTLLRSDAAVPAAKYWLRFKGWNELLITYF